MRENDVKIEKKEPNGGEKKQDKVYSVEIRTVQNACTFKKYLSAVHYGRKKRLLDKSETQLLV